MSESAHTLHTKAPANRLPLRVTLIALVIALVGFALLATGLAATSLLRGYLTGQQDTGLRSLIQTTENDRAATLRACDMSADLRFTGNTYLACLAADGAPQQLRPAGYSDGRLPDITAITPATITDWEGDPFTVDSLDDSTQWRMVATQLPTGEVVVVGIDLAADQRVLARLVVLELVTGLVVLVTLGVAGSLLVRNSLRPLVEVEHTARAIAAGDLSQRVPVGDDRTEVGRLSTALNGMLGRIEASFQAQRTSQEQARESEEQARESESRMRRFVADASHELRTPLTSIRGFAELHRQGAAGGPQDTERIMHRIESEATRMGMLVEDLLQLARLDQQRGMDAVPVDLAELAGDAVHDARAVQPDRPIDLVLDPGLTEDPVLLGDEARLRQVIGNLVTNALTHTPPGTPVTVRISEPPGDPDTLVVAVADQGPGMSEADAARVFERFYRADASRTRAVGGTGLGLSIVSSLVAAHGGTVAVATEPGLGATFTVTLPRSGPPDALVPEED